MLNFLRNLGIKPNYQLWEIFLTRKINFILGVATLNLIIFQIIFGLIMGFDYMVWFLLTAQICILLTIYTCIRFHYLFGIYGFFSIGICLVMFMSALLGPDSNMQLYYFPIVLNIVQLLGRKETRHHLYFFLILLTAALITLALFYANEYLLLDIPKQQLFSIKTFNLVMSSVVTMVFIVLLTFQNQVQESKINEMLKEKDVLMAEVFHRVKNNMNIITSLLNLKKHTAESEETIRVLDDCRNRVFSMALVHQKLFNQASISELNFGEYARALVNEISKSYGGADDHDIVVEADEILLKLDQAIPCGLILNEAITNTFKHARTARKKLAIRVSLKKSGSQREICITDNGPGMAHDEKNHDAMGLELIQSLCEQIDGQCTFVSDGDGFTVRVTFLV